MSETIFIHGCAGQTSSWDGVVTGLPSDIALRRLGLPGHGTDARQPPPGGFDDIIDGLWSQLGDGQGLRLVGYSLGARIAMRMALCHPSRVAELVLVAGHPGIEDEDAREARRTWDQGWADRLRVGGVSAFVDEWEQLPIFSSQHALPLPMRQAHRARRLEHHPEGLAWSFEHLGLGSMPPCWKGLSEFEGRVSVLVGELDHKYCRIARRLVESCTRASLIIVPNCGHDLLLEAPDAVAATLRALVLQRPEHPPVPRVRP